MMDPSVKTRIPSDGEPSRILAYWSPDDVVAVWNNLAKGGTEIERAPQSPGAAHLRAAWLGPPSAPRLRRVAPLEQVDGYGVFTFPYGPISMGVPEAGRFDVRTYGERVLDISPEVGFKARRILSSVAGLTIEDAALRIERLAGPFSAAHVSAFLAATESAAGRGISAREAWIRALAQELQRIYNHIHVVARVAEAASQNVGLAQAHALAEDVLRLMGSTFGHRWLFGAFLPGGPPTRLGPDDRVALAGTLGRLSKEFERLWSTFQTSRTFLDRIQTTCGVSREETLRWGAVGPTLRATGVAWDDRLRSPVPPYTDLFLPLATESSGDALGRVLVRVLEVRSSFLLLEQMLERWPASGSTQLPASEAIAPGRGVARVESPSGDLVYDVSVHDGRVGRVSARTASDANWPLFALGMRDAVFTDFHFAWESFGILFAETDR